MDLQPYFAVDDGSLPEVQLRGGDPAAAFARLFERGAKDVTVGGAMVHPTGAAEPRRFAGAGDAVGVCAGLIKPFHVVLRGIGRSSEPIPDLGVTVNQHSLTLDYRMGAEWNSRQVKSFLRLLAELGRFRCEVTVEPWWGTAAQAQFAQALQRLSRPPPHDA